MSKLPKLYKLDTKNKVREWQIFYQDNFYYAIKGVKGGKMVKDKPTYCVAKNVGRSNETTPEEQAMLEANAKWDKKIKQGYVRDVQDLHIQQFYKPMLAKLYENEKAKVKYPVYLQTKLDGCRLIAMKEGIFSRTGERMTSMPHIERQLKSFFLMFPEAILDGEVYNHDYRDNLNRIVSIYRKQKPERRERDTDNSFAKKEASFAEALEESERVLEYHIYDLPHLGKPNPDSGWDIMEINESTNFVLRMDMLKQFLNPDLHKNIKIVPTYRVDDEDNLEHLYEEFINVGYEGAIVRLDASYENKRSSNLLKKKDFIDDEFTIIDVLEGQGNKSGIAATLTCVTNKKPSKEFDCNLRGDFKFCEELLKNKKDYIGKKATVKFLKYSEYNIPIGNPVALAIGDEK